MFLNINNNLEKSFLQLLAIPTSLIKLTWVGFVIVSRVSEISLACLSATANSSNKLNEKNNLHSQ